MSRIRASLAQRFWLKVMKTDGDQCWLWTGAKDSKGYGNISLGGRGAGYRKSSRVAWELVNGPAPEGMAVCHKCDNPSCVRPDRLFLGTQRENLADMRRKGRGGPHYIDMTGRRYGRLTAIERVRVESIHTHWKCLCDCGSEAIVAGYLLRNGSTRSCGCLRREMQRLSPQKRGAICFELVKESQG